MFGLHIGWSSEGGERVRRKWRKCQGLIRSALGRHSEKSGTSCITEGRRVTGHDPTFPQATLLYLSKLRLLFTLIPLFFLHNRYCIHSCRFHPVYLLIQSLPHEMLSFYLSTKSKPKDLQNPADDPTSSTKLSNYYLSALNSIAYYSGVPSSRTRDLS